MPYYANINPSYDGGGPHAGTVLDPFDYAELLARAHSSTGTGNVTDEYYIMGRRDLGSGAGWKIGKGALFARWGKNPWMVINSATGFSNVFGNASGASVYSGGVLIHTSGAIAEVTQPNVTWRNFHLQTAGTLVIDQSGCSIEGSTMIGSGTPISIPSGTTVTAIDSYITGVGQWVSTKGTLNATYTAFRFSAATAATFGIGTPTNEFDNTNIPNTTRTSFGNQYDYLPYETTVSLSVPAPANYLTGLFGNPRTGIGSNFFQIVSLDVDLVAEADIQFTNFSEFGYADIQLADNGRDLLGDRGLESATLLSLFTNQRVNDEKLLPGNANDKGGWWGLEFTEFTYGSRLWLLRRSKNMNEMLPLAEQYAKEALQWMIDQEVAQRIDVTASFLNAQTIMMDIQIYRPEVSEEQRYTYRYFFNWENQIVRRG
jgi:phage gp46-like protein